MTSTPTRARRVVIAGSGAAAWLSAATLARALVPGEYSIRVVPCGAAADRYDPLRLADTTLPWLAGGNDPFDLDEDRLLAQTGGAFSFGVALTGWSNPQATYFHPFGSFGAKFGPLSFHNIVTRLRRERMPLRLSNYSLAALAAQAGRFARPSRDPRSVQSTCHYGLQLDGAGLTGFLEREALAAGVDVVADALESVERDERGIRTLITAGGQHVDGDLFLDCSGPAALLCGDGPQSYWHDWSQWLRCNRVVSAFAATPQPPGPYSHAEAISGGWIRHVFLQGRTALSSFSHSSESSDSAVLSMLRTRAANTELIDENVSEVAFGRRDNPWDGNCVALGCAAAVIDPVGVSNLQFLRIGIIQLLSLLPGGIGCAAEAAEYNRRMTGYAERARDFAMAHYKLNRRHGEPFWDGCRDMAVPDSLQYRLDLFAARGRIALFDDEPFDEDSWINLFDEHGIQPSQRNPIAEGVDVGDLEAHVRRARAMMIEELGKMPLHSEYLSGLTGASK